MTDEWQVVQLAQVAIVTSGKRPPVVVKDASPDFSVPVIGGGGQSGFTNETLFDGEVLITGRVGTLGKLFAPKGLCWPSDNALVIRHRSPDTYPPFLRYALQIVIAKAAGMNRGAANPLITQGDLGQLVIFHPPLQEQRAIAHILGTLDDKIELNRRRNQTLEDMARALFKDWFVDFGPVRAKMEGRKPYLPEEIWRLFPERLVDSEMGEIPEGWAVTTLSEFASLNPEAWTKRTRPEQILYVDLSSTKWGRIESVTNYDADDAPSRAQRILRPLDTIVGTVRPGNGSYALISDEGLTGSTGFAVLRPLRRECSEFVYLTATARENIERLSNLADGGAYPAVQPEIVSATPVPRADEKLINQFSRQVCSMVAGIADNERESRTLAALRDTLLPKLISGELRLHNALTHVEEIARVMG